MSLQAVAYPEAAGETSRGWNLHLTLRLADLPAARELTLDGGAPDLAASCRTAAGPGVVPLPPPPLPH